jgi:hypothetical protein
MVLKPKRPTLAKTALGWGTLKFRYVRMQRWATPLGRFCNIGKDLLILNSLAKCHRAAPPPVNSIGLNRM